MNIEIQQPIPQTMNTKYVFFMYFFKYYEK